MKTQIRTYKGRIESVDFSKQRGSIYQALSISTKQKMSLKAIVVTGEEFKVGDTVEIKITTTTESEEEKQ